MGRYLFLITIFSLIANVISCPQAVLSYCKCDENSNGIILDCSHQNGAEIIQILRNNQVHLGLMQSLIMKNANISEIPANFFQGLFIKQLDLSYNSIKEISKKAFNGMSNVLTELNLSNNKISKIPSSAIESQRNLFRLDLANNTIGDLRADDTLPTLPKLFDVNLSGNKICKIQGAIFEKVKSSLQTVNLGNNCLTSVPSQAIRGQTQLQSLHLHRNRLTSLEALSFLNLPVLQLLNLANNQISDINTQAFINVPNLRYLYLTNNRISKLIKHQFSLFERLEFLDLTRNQIKKIPVGAFAELSSLRQLYLGNNSISTIEKEAFTNSSIVILVLADNQLTELGEDVISGLANLQQLSFKKNQITQVNPNAFHNIPSTVFLDLSNNFISDLSPNTFLAQINLLFIDLSHNNFTKTPHAVLNRRIGTVVLKENPLVCSEKVHMVQDGVSVYLPNTEDLICGGKTTTTEVPSLIPDISEEPVVQTEEINQAEQSDEPTTEEPPMNPLKVRPVQIKKNPQPIQHLPAVEPVTQPPTPALIPSTNIPSRTAEPESTVSTVPLRPEDNPKRILPFPIPFLKLGPQHGRQGQVVRVLRPSTTTTTETPIEEEAEVSLPPSIITASNRHLSDEVSQILKQQPVNIEQFALKRENEATNMDVAPKISKSKAYPTVAIIVCISTVLVIMILVFSILCALRHKQRQRLYSREEVLPNFADPSIASQMMPSSIRHSSPSKRRDTHLHANNAQPWLYNPGPNYCNYYK